MTFFKERLKDVKALIFDIDGVLSLDTMVLDEDGVPTRTANVKDGYAMRNAVNMGYHLGIITGGNLERVRMRYESLGVNHIYMGVRDKMKCLDDFMIKTGVKLDEILYMGDDLVDYQVMEAVGVPVCPLDAVSEIKEISSYISDKKGGEGCARDIIEQVMKAQNTWINEHSYFWRSI
ncbi:KdsC family phosphatase [Sunxiuqinia elliptica]|uniref:3-deoxy-D-manno-octulosonate 8-phosphate phosphatase (KDO 8-P phosphatase) n=1 Tax=Sunxiuqinia elliptica TaxID=655355 RepID=A0A4R6GKU3_9BACT|nr:HAD hydrolase family protein [Sunxiuqinia elliptica]TDN95742.1 3-deoxy-D-manno-octulosonate 8-phosphate phosphatase (KDO 8-P phosphatase) [Sunxiuqinia elliptica]TDO66937.1 3-deoxy-D-manno-octulosonate 8-phosphate phosphatase (KDO 8-P phosphatase) [Sunxiuqinia elliptica]